MKYLKNIKKNQIVIYVIALMLIVAGYMNYTDNNNFRGALQASASDEELTKTADIGDAKLVSSNIENELVENEINEDKSINIDNNNHNIVEASNTIKENNDYFSTSKLERDSMYSQMIESYEKILNSNNSIETQKQSAQDEIKKINDTKNSIMICENLIKTKGFKNSIVFVNGDSISVIVEKDNLEQEEVSQIQNIVSREMNAKIENIHISNK